MCYTKDKDVVDMRYRNRHIIYGFVIVFIIALVVWIGYLVYVELIRPSRNHTPQIVETSAKKEINQNKIFIDKAFVFQATYSKDKQLRLPMINLNSQDALEANQEIQTKYKTLRQEKQEMTQKGQNIISQYQYTIHEDILSILIYIQHRNQEQVTYSYMTYHFYLSSGNQVPYREVYQKASIYDFNIELKVKDSLYRWMENYSDLSFEEKNQYVQQAMSTYQEAVKNNTIQYYFDIENRFYVILPVQEPNRSELVYKIFTL